MADDRLRELERRFRASGSPEDEARWLLLRMRTGAVTGEAVELAAYVGSPAARLLRRRPTPDGWLVAPSDPRWPADVDPDRAPLPIEEACDATGFGDGIGRWGRQASVRAALGAVHALWPVWLTKNDWNDRVDDRRRPRRRYTDFVQDLLVGMIRCVEAVEEWVLCPCDQHRQQVWDTRTGPVWTEGLSFAASGNFTQHGRLTLGYCSRELPEADVRRAVRDAIVPWTLGYGDPVRDYRAKLARNKGRHPKRRKKAEPGA